MEQDRKEYLDKLMKECKKNMIIFGKNIYKLNNLSYENNNIETRQYIIDYKNRFLVYLDMLMYDTIPLYKYIKESNYFIDDNYNKWDIATDIIINQLDLSSLLIKSYNNDYITEDDLSKELVLKNNLFKAINDFINLNSGCKNKNQNIET